MHDHGNRDSLVYWLEFKDDEEFPAIFGSIAGGSALKFGIHRRRETGLWTTGSPTKQRSLTMDEAVVIARRHRDQLMRASELISSLPANARVEDYEALQADLSREAPEVQNTDWGHKYLGDIFSYVHHREEIIGRVKEQLALAWRSQEKRGGELLVALSHSKVSNARSQASLHHIAPGEIL